MPDTNDAPTIIGRGQRVPTPQYARNLLGDPEAVDKPLADLSWEQRLSLTIVRLSEDVASLSTYGCQQGLADRKRIAKVEAFTGAIRTAFIVLACAGGAIVTIFSIFEGVKRLVH